MAKEDLVWLPNTFLDRRGMDPKSVAPSWLKTASAILDGFKDVTDLSQMYGGRAAKPGEMTVVGQDVGRPLMIMHDKDTEVAEIEDAVLEAQERKRTPYNFEEARERRGLPSAKEFDALLKQAMADHVTRAKRSRVTMHPRDPMNQFVRGLVTVPALAHKEEKKDVLSA